MTDDDIISTCPKFSDVDVQGKYRIAIQYLHSYPYYGAVGRTETILWKKPFKAEKVIFITAYKAFEEELKKAGLRAVFIPMTIDVDAVAKHKLEKQYKKRFIYFGNIIHNKLHLYNKLKQHCENTGWKLDTISIGRLNKGSMMSRENLWKEASKYEYGIAVGRCAQELHALGVKTLIAGHKFGGIITTDNDYRLQLNTNMNGRIQTYSEDLERCVKNIHKSIIKTTDIKSLNHAEIVKEAYNL